jgi:hypothetical protein
LGVGFAIQMSEVADLDGHESAAAASDLPPGYWPGQDPPIVAIVGEIAVHNLPLLGFFQPGGSTIEDMRIEMPVGSESVGVAEACQQLGGQGETLSLQSKHLPELGIVKKQAKTLCQVWGPQPHPIETQSIQ